MKHDPSTSFAYPSLGNYCSHCRPPAIPTVVHQGAFCLRDAHPDCPVYQQPANQAFPLSSQTTAHSHRKPIARNVILAALAFLLVLAGWWMFGRIQAAERKEAAPPAAPMTPRMILSNTPVASETPLPLPSKTRLARTRTPEQFPTRMPTSLQPVHALEFPFKVGEHSFLLHRIREGENFEILETTYVTSAEAILALNHSLSSPLWVDSVIVISPGLESADPQLPAFQAFEITDPQVSIDEVAQQLSVNEGLLRYYNHCSENCLLSAGDWLLVPYVEK